MFAGYDSDSDDSAPEVPGASPSEPASSSMPATTMPPPSKKDGATMPPPSKKKVVDYNSLIKGVSKPLNLQAAVDDEDFTPTLPKSRPGLLSSLPPPKKRRTQEVDIPGLVTPPVPSSSSREMPIQSSTNDEAEIEGSDEDSEPAAASSSFFNFGSKDDDMLEDVPVSAAPPPVIPIESSVDESHLVEHPVVEPQASAPALPMMTGLTAREMQELREAADTSSFTDVRAENLNDPLWYIKGAASKNSVTGIMKSVFEAQENKVGDATTSQKRKHQINWLAAEYHEKGAEILEKNASSRNEQGNTARKYGW